MGGHRKKVGTLILTLSTGGPSSVSQIWGQGQSHPEVPQSRPGTPPVENPIDPRGGLPWYYPLETPLLDRVGLRDVPVFGGVLLSILGNLQVDVCK